MAEGDSNSSMHQAARQGNVEAVRQHLSVDAETLNARDRLSRTPYPRLQPLLLQCNRLHLAAWAGQADVVRVLCHASADVGAAALDDMAAIHFASQKGHTEVVSILLAAGAYVNAKNRKGMTPLHFAVQGKRESLTKLLISKGANLYTENKAGKKPIDLLSDEKFHALVKDAELVRNARRAKTSKAKQSGRDEAGGQKEPREAAEDVRHITVPERPVTQNEELMNGNSHPRDVEQKTEVEAVSEREGDLEGNQSMESRRKKAKVSLSHLSFDDDNEDEINVS